MDSYSLRWRSLVLIGTFLFPLITEATSFSYGDPLKVHESNLQINTVEMARLDTTRTLLLYAADDEGRMAVATRDGAALTKGTEYELGSAIDRGAVTILDSTHAAVTYIESTTGSGKAVIATIAGNDISFGTPATFKNKASIDSNYALAVTTLDSTRFALAYMSLEEGTDDFGDPEQTNSGSVVIGSVSGTNISFGTPQIYSRMEVDDHDIVALDSSKFVITYDTADGASGVVGTVSGTDITLGTPVEYVDNGSFHQNDMIDSSRFIVAYQSITGGSSRIGVVSGTTITFGAEHAFSAQTSIAISVAAINDTTATIVYGDYGGLTHGTVTIASISGNSITTGDSSVFGAYMNASSVILLDDETSMIGYYSLDDFKGYVLIAHRDLPESSSSSSSSSTTENSTPRGGGRRGSPGRGGIAQPLNVLRPADSPAPENRTTSSFETRTCNRVMKWFKGNKKMLGRVNERLEKRFKFICTE